MIYKILVLLSIIFACSVMALEPISDGDLESVTGQNGVYLSGDITLNDTGGPLLSSDAGNRYHGTTDVVWGTCNEKQSGAVDRCGARISIQTNSTDGHFVLDEMRGKMSFEGLTLKAREITTEDDFGGDEVDFAGDTVLEIGLPNKVRFEDLSYTIATSSTARPTDEGFTQQDVFGVEIDGTIQMQGNLLIFPTGTP